MKNLRFWICRCIHGGDLAGINFHGNSIGICEEILDTWLDWGFGGYFRLLVDISCCRWSSLVQD
eukprot:scaffold4847_cov48-Attheya_sp.AAC.2